MCVYIYGGFSLDFPASGHVWCFMSQASFAPPRTILVASTMILALSNLDEPCKPWVLLPIVVRFTLDISILLYCLDLKYFKMIYHKMNQAIQSYNALSFFSLFFSRGTTAKMEARHLRSWRTRCWNGPPRSRSWKAAAPGRSVERLMDGRKSSNVGQRLALLAEITSVSSDWFYCDIQVCVIALNKNE